MYYLATNKSFKVETALLQFLSNLSHSFTGLLVLDKTSFPRTKFLFRFREKAEAVTMRLRNSIKKRKPILGKTKQIYRRESPDDEPCT